MGATASPSKMAKAKSLAEFKGCSACPKLLPKWFVLPCLGRLREPRYPNGFLSRIKAPRMRGAFIALCYGQHGHIPAGVINKF